jgi:hypothetical protein
MFRTIWPYHMLKYIRCSFCRLIRHSEHLIGRHWYLPANWRSFIRWSPDQWVSQCCAIECDRSFYCALFCVFMTPVSQCPVCLHAENPLYLMLNKETVAVCCCCNFHEQVPRMHTYVVLSALCSFLFFAALPVRSKTNGPINRSQIRPRRTFAEDRSWKLLSLQT